MKSIRWKLLCAYLIFLVSSWLVMSVRRPPPSPGEGWQAFSMPGRGGEPAEVRYRKFPGSDPGATPLILVHGSPVASSAFDPLIAELRGERTLLVPDLPGFGASYAGFSDLSFSVHGEALEQLLEHENINKAHWLAYSQGGGPALMLTAEHPEAFASLTLLSSIGVQEYELTGDYFLNHILHGAQWMVLEALRWGVPHFGWLDVFPLNTHYAKNFYQGDMRPLRSRLKEFSPPMLIIHGKTDGLVMPSAAREHHRIVPQSDLVWLPGGHMIPVSRPGEVADIERKFLRNVETGQVVTRQEAGPDRRAEAAQPFDSRVRALTGGVLGLTLLALGISTLVSEDLACISAGLLAARGLVPLPEVIMAVFAGIWIGDMALYAAGRWGGGYLVRRRPLRWFTSRRALDYARAFLQRKGMIAIFISRFTPGLRLPLYLASGVVKAPFWKMSRSFFLAGLFWTIPVVWFIAHFGQHATEGLMGRGAAVFPLGVLLILLPYLGLKLVNTLMTHRGRRIFLSSCLRIVKWEFWPSFCYYTPVVLTGIREIVRGGNPLLCTAANPAIPYGGIMGESKSDILTPLLSSGAVIPFLRLPEGDASEKITAATAWHDGFPLVVKPDVGERGRDVVIVRSREELEEEIRRRPEPTLLQHYAGGEEFGVFYLHHPEEEQGRIISITIKKMTSVKGDGSRTLEELILDDDRAFLSWKFFRHLHADKLNWIPPEGEQVGLSKLGTHCRGARFLNGNHLITPALEEEIDRIASSFPGFHFGRFDLRCPDANTLKRGEGIRVIELNGLTSEATHIYDPQTPLKVVWTTPISQWRQAYEIGCANVRRGAAVPTWREVFALLMNHTSGNHTAP